MIDFALLLAVLTAVLSLAFLLWNRLAKHGSNCWRIPLRIAVLASVILPVELVAAWRLMNRQDFQLMAPLVSRVETTRQVVALTIDDGPGKTIQDVMRTLDGLRVRATFFVNGGALSEAPERARALVAAGHEIGNHTFSHQRMIFRSQGFIRDEVERTDTLIRDAGHQGAILFRPPFGKKLLALPYYLKRTHRTTLMADIQPDSLFRDTADMVRYALHNTRPGSVVLLHALGRPASHEAIPGIVHGLRNQGYRFVTASELLAEAPSAATVRKLTLPFRAARSASAIP
jgi:peptidoglycan-N-acetylglucosamine deacetylase